MFALIMKWCVVHRNKPLIACTAVKFVKLSKKQNKKQIKYIEGPWNKMWFGEVKHHLLLGPAVMLLTLLKSWQLLAAGLRGHNGDMRSQSRRHVATFACSQQHSILQGVALSVLCNIQHHARGFDSACLHSFWHWPNGRVNSKLLLNNCRKKNEHGHSGQNLGLLKEETLRRLLMY